MLDILKNSLNNLKNKIMERYSRKEFDERRGLENLIPYSNPQHGDIVYVDKGSEIFEVRVNGFSKDSVGFQRIKFNLGATSDSFADLKNVYKLKDYKVRNTPDYTPEKVSFRDCSPQEQQRVNNICNGYNINYGIIPGIRHNDL